MWGRTVSTAFIKQCCLQVWFMRVMQGTVPVALLCFALTQLPAQFRRSDTQQLSLSGRANIMKAGCTRKERDRCEGCGALMIHSGSSALVPGGGKPHCESWKYSDLA